MPVKHRQQTLRSNGIIAWTSGDLLHRIITVIRGDKRLEVDQRSSGSLVVGLKTSQATQLKTIHGTIPNSWRCPRPWHNATGGGVLRQKGEQYWRWTVINFTTGHQKSFWMSVFHRVEDGLLVEFMYLVFTRLPGESYRRRLRSLLLCLCDVYLSAN